MCVRLCSSRAPVPTSPPARPPRSSSLCRQAPRLRSHPSGNDGWWDGGEGGGGRGLLNVDFAVYSCGDAVIIPTHPPSLLLNSVTLSYISGGQEMLQFYKSGYTLDYSMAYLYPEALCSPQRIFFSSVFFVCVQHFSQTANFSAGGLGLQPAGARIL